MSKIIPVTRSSMPPLEEYVELLQGVWDSRRLTNFGRLHEELEQRLKEYLGVSHLALFSNGHTALEIALSTLPKIPKGEIITTAYSFCSTVNAIVRSGYTPVFCDIKETDFTINPELIEQKITPKTVAVVATHVYGFPCDDKAISDIAKRHKLKVIYDAAHAFGVKYKGMGIAGFGDISMLSTHATKVFHTIEGGILCTRDAETAKKARELSNFGFSDEGELTCPGPNAKMNEFEAAMGICNLRYIDGEINKRKIAAERYIERLSGKAGIYVPIPSDDTVWNYAYFPVLFDGAGDTRDKVADRLTAQSIMPRKYFSPALHLTECYRSKYKDISLPVTERVAEQILTLPLYAELTTADVDRICDIILYKGVFSK